MSINQTFRSTPRQVRGCTVGAASKLIVRIYHVLMLLPLRKQPQAYLQHLNVSLRFATFFCHEV